MAQFVQLQPVLAPAVHSAPSPYQLGQEPPFITLTPTGPSHLFIPALDLGAARVVHHDPPRQTGAAWPLALADECWYGSQPPGRAIIDIGGRLPLR